MPSDSTRKNATGTSWPLKTAGGMVLAALLINPAPTARAQFDSPPPLNSFTVEGEGSPGYDEEGLNRLFNLEMEGAGPNSVSAPLTPPPSASGGAALGSSVPNPFPEPNSAPSTVPLPPSAADLAPAGSADRPLGNLPAPVWEDGGDQGPWIQLEIGQTDTPSTSDRLTPPPTSTSSIPRETTGSDQAESAPPAVEAAVDQAMDQAIQAPAGGPGPLEKPAIDRQHLRQLFSDFRPPESQSVQGLSSGSPPAPLDPAAALPAVPAPTINESSVADSSILRAGDLLSTQGQVGAAEILPPLTGKVDWQTKAPAESPPARTSPASSAPAPAVKSPAQTASKAPAVKSGPKSSGGSSAKSKAGGSKSSAPKTTGPAPSSVQLVIVNETGSDRVGQLYSSVLGKIGYKVMSVANRAPGAGQTGQTVIHYRAGQRAKAQAVARHLPGKKVLREAAKGESLGSEVMVYIR